MSRVTLMWTKVLLVHHTLRHHPRPAGMEALLLRSLPRLLGILGLCRVQEEGSPSLSPQSSLPGTIDWLMLLSRKALPVGC